MWATPVKQALQKVPVKTRARYADSNVHLSRIASASALGVFTFLLHCGGDADAGAAPDKGLPTRSEGCGKELAVSPPDGTVATVGARKYRFFVPSGYAKDQAYPVVYVMHGLGADSLKMSQFIKMQEYTQGKAIVVFPDAAGGTWDVKGSSDLEFFDAMSEQVNAAACTNPARVYVEGFSLGAYVTNYLGCKRGAKIRGIAAADGGFPGDPAGCAEIPALIYHKTQDDNEVVANGKAARDKWKSINGCGDETEKYGSLACVSYGGCKAGTSLVWCEDGNVTKYAHDLDAAYRTPIWEWFDSLK